MKTAIELFNELQPELEEIDKEREETIDKIIFLDGVFIILYFLQFLFLDPSTIFFLTFKFELFGILLLIGGNLAIVEGYAKKFKAIIIPEILNCFIQNSSYSPTQSISSIEDLMKSGFAKTTPKGIQGEDLVTGKIENVVFAFSEIDAFEMINLRGPKKITTLEGGFFMANLSNNIIEKLDIKGKFPFDKFLSYLIHKVPHFVAGGFFIFLINLIFLIFTLFFYAAHWYGLNLLLLSVYVMYILYNIFIYYIYVPKGFKKVDSGNPSLEKKFSIYSTEPVDAKKLFTPEFQKALLLLQEKTLMAASVHIRKNTVYIFIPSGVNLFEPRLFRKNSLEVIQETYDLWQGLHDVITSLNSGNQKYQSILLH